MKRAAGTYVVTVADDGSETWEVLRQASKQEEETVTALLEGRIKKVGKKMIREFLSGEEEYVARIVLAELIRYGWLHNSHRLELAALLVSDTHPRQLVFHPRRRRRGRAGTGFDFDIALDLDEARHNDLKFDSAVAEMVEKYGVSERSVTRAWGKHKHVVPWWTSTEVSK